MIRILNKREKIMSNFHPTAVISSNAKIADDVSVGPFAVVEGNVEIGSGSAIGPHAVIYDGARIGSNVKIHQGASIANVPQDLKFGNEETFCFIGDNTVVREFCTLNRGTGETGKVSIGKNILLMAYAHVAHDCFIGDNCIIANAVQIAGHVSIDEYAIIGGSSVVHQFTKIGKHVMIGGGIRIPQDVPPFILAAHDPAHFTGLNAIGLRRRGFDADQLTTLKSVYDILYNSKLNVSQAKLRISEEYPDDPLANEVLDFLNKINRGIIRKWTGS